MTYDHQAYLDMLSAEDERIAARAAYVSVVMNEVKSKRRVAEAYASFLQKEEAYLRQLKLYRETRSHKEDRDRMVPVVYYHVLPNGDKSGPYLYSASSTFSETEIASHVLTCVISPFVDGVIIHTIDDKIINLVDIIVGGRSDRPSALYKSLPYDPFKEL